MFIACLLLWIPLAYDVTVQGATTIATQVSASPKQLAEPPSDLDIFPSSYLPGVSKHVQLTCRPPVNGQVVKVLLIQLDKVESGTSIPVVTMLSDQSPVVELKGSSFHARATGYFDPNPVSSYLRVDLPEPKEDAAGSYVCIVETVDSHGLLHRYLETETLTSLGRGGVIPSFYRTILLELKADADNVTNDFSKVSDIFHNQDTVWGPASQAKLNEVNQQETLVRGLVADVNTKLADVTQRENSMKTEVDRLRNITPETKVNFYTYYSGTYLTPSNDANVIFNVQDQHTDNSYSTSTGIFTCPRNGTYFFRTGLSASGQQLYGSIKVGNEIVSSAFAYDDYNVKGSTADAIVELVVGDQVRVVQTSGAGYNVYGYVAAYGSVNHISYFMGMLLW